MIEELNTVIEFQHSYISLKDFSARNTFYPENFLKQFKAINDANIPSIDNLNLKAPEKSQLMRWQQKYDLY